MKCLFCGSREHGIEDYGVAKATMRAQKRVRFIIVEGDLGKDRGGVDRERKEEEKTRRKIDRDKEEG